LYGNEDVQSARRTVSRTKPLKRVYSVRLDNLVWNGPSYYAEVLTDNPRILSGRVAGLIKGNFPFKGGRLLADL
jgi:hypothetical protein